MAVAVRAARGSDLDALIALDDIVRELHAALYPEDFALQADRDAVKARFAALLHETGHALIVAEADGAVAAPTGSVVGYAWIELQVRPALFTIAATASTCTTSQSRPRHAARASQPRCFTISNSARPHMASGTSIWNPGRPTRMRTRSLPRRVSRT